jgi:hypothetical protein
LILIITVIVNVKSPMLQKRTKQIIEIAAKADGIDIQTIRAAITLLEGKRMDQEHSRPLAVNQAEAARLLGVSRFTVRKMVNRGLLKPIQLADDCIRYSMAQLEELTGQV